LQANLRRYRSLFLLLSRAARLMLELARRIVALKRDFPRRTLGIILTRLISRSSYGAEERKRPGFSPCQVYNQRFSGENHSRERERLMLFQRTNLRCFAERCDIGRPLCTFPSNRHSRKCSTIFLDVPNNAVTVTATFSLASLA